MSEVKWKVLCVAVTPVEGGYAVTVKTDRLIDSDWLARVSADGIEKA